MIKYSKIIDGDENMKVKSSFLKSLSERSLVALLLFSFVCTLLGFGIAYNEHRSLAELSDKYDEAIVKIDQCQSAISNLSEMVTMTQTTLIPTTFADVSQPDDIVSQSHKESDSESSTTQSKPDKTTQSQPVSGQYYVTQSGSKYHISSCSYLSKSRIAVSLETIRSKGYSPCSRCIK